MNSSSDAQLSIEQIRELHPRLYHMAHAGSWPSILRHGLLSTTALLDRFGITAEERNAIEAQRRPATVEIHHPEHGTAAIRDNIPMRESALQKCLTDCTPEQWYRMLNQRVFFWTDPERLERLLGARAYRTKTQLVLTVDTGALLARHADRVSLSPINSGATLYNPVPRGTATFLPISKFPFNEWRRKRKPNKVIVELTVKYSVPDIEKIALRAEHWKNGAPSELIWAAK